MEILVTAIVALVLTAVVIVVSRAGANRHQEDLDDHRASAAPPAPSGDGPERPREPKSDRPAGPDAEATGVAGAGEPSVDPSAERRD